MSLRLPANEPEPLFEELLEAWDGETAVVHRDRETGGWIFICLHSTRLGPAAGGTRMRVYATPGEALRDAMRLSAAMTKKLAIAGLPLGGGKAVLAVPGIPTGRNRRELFLRYGDLVESLGGTFRTSSDMNTGEADLDVVWERTRYVFGRSLAMGGAGSPAPPTAMGVFHGIRASLGHLYGTATTLKGRRVVVQGAGGVGSVLADLLTGAGASVLISDLDRGRAEAVASRVGCTVVSADEAAGTDCDVFAPCAVGGVLDSESIPRLRCRIVAGSANNQLADERAGELLQQCGILYAPDYIINAGGAIALVGIEQLGWSSSQADAALAGIGETLRWTYERSEAQHITPSAVADALAQTRLASEPDDLAGERASATRERVSRDIGVGPVVAGV